MDPASEQIIELYATIRAAKDTLRFLLAQFK
jgi:hypothetical protein